MIAGCWVDLKSGPRPSRGNGRRVALFKRVNTDYVRNLNFNLGLALESGVESLK